MSLELGPCAAYLGTAGSEADLGKTHGGVTVRITDDRVDLKSDQYGTGPEDSVITGTVVEVEMSLAEVTFDELAIALNQTKFGSLLTGGVTGENNVGTSMLSAAKSLILKKYVSGALSTDETNWITFPAACPASDVELTYDADNQRVLKITFKCFPKEIEDKWGTGTDNKKTVTYFFGKSDVAS